MNAHTDKQILNALKDDPQRGMALLMESYTGLIWKVISFHLKNPEDIRECVNDTFAAFYFRREKYQADTASLAVYLTAIARRLAISRYRREKQHTAEALPPEPACADKGLELIDIQEDLSRAMASLKPDELQIIRMKYYGGMTIREIADSLNLPYETVKKRHQRSIGKLRHVLMLTLLILLLMALTACTYGILQHLGIVPKLFGWEIPSIPQSISVQREENSPFAAYADLPFTLPELLELAQKPDSDEAVPATVTASSEQTVQPESLPLPDGVSFVPGIGIKTDGSATTYSLKAAVTAADDRTVLLLQDASYMNGCLHVSIDIRSKTLPFINGGNCRDKIDFWGTSNINLYYQDTYLSPTYSSGYSIDDYTRRVEIDVQDFKPNLAEDEPLELSAFGYDITMSFVLTPVTYETITGNYLYQMKEYGGLMIDPHLENGSLIIAIYPVDTGEYKTLPGLIRGLSGEKIDDDAITATASDGTVLTGHCIRYRPFSDDTYFRWDFGPAAPGTYRLNIPFVFQTNASVPETSIQLDLKNSTWEDKDYPIPGGTVRITSLSERIEVIPGVNDILPDGNHIQNCEFYSYCSLSYTSDKDTHTIAGIHPFSSDSNTYFLSDNGNGTIDFVMEKYLHSSEIDTGIIVFHDYMKRSSIYYRWDANFDFTFTVE